jgi:peptidyl-prolyl cis-trans isomerase D
MMRPVFQSLGSPFPDEVADYRKVSEKVTMLEAIRKRVSGIVVKGFLVILIASFAIWGIGDTVRGISGISSVAEIGGEEVTPEQLLRAVRLELRQLEGVFGRRLEPDQARAMGIPNMALLKLIDRTLYYRAASELGVSVGDAQVSREIRKNAAFRNLFGQFDQDKFRQVLYSNGMNEGLYVAAIRGDLERGQYINSLRNGAVAPPYLAQRLYRHQNEKRIALSYRIANEDMTGIEEPDDAALNEYHRSNALVFTAPEYRKVTLVTLEPDDLIGGVSVSDEELQESYDARTDEFTTAEKRHLLQMILSDEETAKRARSFLERGRDFAEVAKELTGAPEDTLDLGVVSADELLPGLEGGAFATRKGDVTQPLKTSFGWHVLKVLDIEGGVAKSFEEVKQGLFTELAREKATDSLYDLSNRLEDGLGGGATLEEVATRLGLKLHTLGVTDRNGINLEGDLVEDLPLKGAYLKTAFSTFKGLESALIEVNDSYFVVRVDDITIAQFSPLEDVREDVIRGVMIKRRFEKSRDVAQALLDGVSSGKPIEALAREFSLAAAATTPPLTRTPSASSAALPQDLVNDLFSLKTGQAALGKGVDGYYVLLLKEIIPADPAADEKGMEALQAKLKDDIRSDILIQLMAGLRNQYPVTINQEAVDQVF